MLQLTCCVAVIENEQFNYYVNQIEDQTERF